MTKQMNLKKLLPYLVITIDRKRQSLKLKGHQILLTFLTMQHVIKANRMLRTNSLMQYCSSI